MSLSVKALFERMRHKDSQRSQQQANLEAGGDNSAAASASVRNEPNHFSWANRQLIALTDKRKVKPKYVVDLSAQLAESEANYFRLLKMLPNFNERDEWRFELGRDNSQIEFHLQITDRAPYTTTLELKQDSTTATQSTQTPSTQNNANQEALAFKTPKLTICLYHDARMAEVVAWENHRRLRPRYSYPNANMYQADEKSQCNRYLSDWLVLCLDQGRTALNLSELGIPALVSK